MSAPPKGPDRKRAPAESLQQKNALLPAQEQKLERERRAGKAVSMSERGFGRTHGAQLRQDMGQQCSRLTSGSSGGLDLRKESQTLTTRKRLLPEPEQAAQRDWKERQRQERLARSRATAAVSRERRRIEVREMGERADALEQENSYLKDLLDCKNQEKQLLARDLDQLLQSQPDAVSIPASGALPAPAGFGRMPDLAPAAVLHSKHAGQQDVGGCHQPHPIWTSPFHGPAPAAAVLGKDLTQGDPCMGEPPFELMDHAPDALAPAAMISGSPPTKEQLQPDSRGEYAPDVLSGASPGTGHSGPSQMPGLVSRGGSAAALQSLDASGQQSALGQSLLPESRHLAGLSQGPKLSAPCWPGPSHSLPDQALLAQLMAPPARPRKALSDGWEEDNEQTLGSESESGQAIERKGSASLPLHLQPHLLQNFSTRGSTSLPTIWGGPDARGVLLGKGTGVYAGPGLIVGLDGQWIRLKPGFRAAPAQQQWLGTPGQPSTPPCWPPLQHQRHQWPSRHARIPEEAESLPDAPEEEAPDHLDLQWGSAPTKYDSRGLEDLQFGSEFEPLGISDQTGLCLQQSDLPPLGLDPTLPGNAHLEKLGTFPPGHSSPITMTLPTWGTQQGTTDAPCEEPDFLNDGPGPS